MSEYEDDIKAMLFSYSRLTSYETCPYAFYLHYILKDRELYPPQNNFYASNGSAAHETFEAIEKGDIDVYDAPEYYTERFNEIKEDIKPKIKQSTFDKTLESFMELSEDWLDGYEIVGVELKLQAEVCGVPFYGFIDLLLRDKTDGRLVLLDHKSAKPFFKKNGEIYANLKHQFHEYNNQAYLYSALIYEEFGEFPKQIVWNHFKDGCKWTTIDFNKKDYYTALEWFNETYHKLLADSEFEPQEYLSNPAAKNEEFYCKNLCNFRDSCEYLDDYKKKQMKEFYKKKK